MRGELIVTNLLDFASMSGSRVIDVDLKGIRTKEDPVALENGDDFSSPRQRHSMTSMRTRPAFMHVAKDTHFRRLLLVIAL